MFHHINLMLKYQNTTTFSIIQMLMKLNSSDMFYAINSTYILVPDVISGWFVKTTCILKRVSFRAMSRISGWLNWLE